jgi:hypothetical protein
LARSTPHVRPKIGCWPWRLPLATITGFYADRSLSARRYRDGQSERRRVPPPVGLGRNLVPFVCGLIAKLGKPVSFVCSLVPLVGHLVAGTGHSRSRGGSCVPVVAGLIAGVGLGGSQLQIDFPLISFRGASVNGDLAVIEEPAALILLLAPSLVGCHTVILRGPVLS